MNKRVELTRAIREYEEDIVIARSLRELMLTSAWKKVIQESYLSKETDRIVDGLVDADATTRALSMDQLTGISSLKAYLSKVIERGELAGPRLKTAQTELAQLSEEL